MGSQSGFGFPLPNAGEGSCEKIENRLLPALSGRIKLGEFQPDAAGEIRILISGNYSCLPESLREVNKPFQPKKAKTMKTAQNMAASFAAMAGAALCAAP